MTRLIVGLLLIVLCCYPAAARGGGNQQTAVVIQMHVDDQLRLPVVRVRFNGGIEGDFLIDTGTKFNLITDKLADQLGLTSQPLYYAGRRVLLSGPKPRALTYVIASVVQLGAIQTTAARFVVTDSANFPQDPSRHIDGALGSDFLSRYTALLDFRNNQLTLRPAGNRASALQVFSGMAGAVEVPLDPTPNGEYSLEVLCNGQPLHLYLDSGCSVTTLDPTIASRLRLTPLGEDDGQTVYGAEPALFADLDSISIHGIRIRSPLVQYPVSGSSPARDLLGADVLSRFRVLLDLSRSRMFLKPIAPSVTRVRLALEAAGTAPAVPVNVDSHRRCLLSLGMSNPGSTIAAAVAISMRRPTATDANGATGYLSGVDLTTGIPELHLGADRLAVDPAGTAESSNSQGSLGYDVLYKFRIDVDLPSQYVELTRPGTDLSFDPRGNGWANTFLDARDRAAAFASLDNRRIVTIWSMRIARTTLYASAARDHFTPISSADLVAADGAAPVHLGRFQAIKLGGKVWKHPVVALMPAVSEVPVLVLGRDFFQWHDVVFDFPNQRAYWRASKTPAPGARYLWSGGGVELRADGHGAMRVSGLLDSSSARDAGLRLGDEVLMVDGQPAAARIGDGTLDSLPDNREVELIVRRQGHRDTEVIRLRPNSLPVIAAAASQPQPPVREPAPSADGAAHPKGIIPMSIGPRMPLSTTIFPLDTLRPNVPTALRVRSGIISSGSVDLKSMQDGGRFEDHVPQHWYPGYRLLHIRPGGTPMRRAMPRLP